MREHDHTRATHPACPIVQGILVLCIVLTCNPDAIAQHVVRGSVRDAVTGEPLPSANILIEGTYRGTITNAEGRYELVVQEHPATLLFRYIGYQSARHDVAGAGVAGPSMQRLNVWLEPATYQLPELVVTGENPAVALMCCVIDRKQAWRATLPSYSANAYTRITISNDTSIFSIAESVSRVFQEEGQGMREVIQSQRRTSNLDEGEVIPAARFMVNLYDDDIESGGYDLVGVTHPRALRIYRFTLEDTRWMDDQLVYDVAVAPRSRLATGFIGTLSVLVDECALLEAKLKPGEAFLFPPPVEQLDVTFHQQYQSFGDHGAWLPVDLRTDIQVKISFGFLLSFPTFRIRQLSRISDYAMDVEIPDSLYADERLMQVDEEAVAADTLLDQEGIGVPLEEPERMAYASIDSTLTFERAFAPSGMLARYVEAEESSDEDHTPRESGSSFGAVLESTHLQPHLRFNRVEGFHGGLSTEHDLGPLRLSGQVGWGSALEQRAWSHDLDGELRLGPGRHVFLGAAHSQRVQPRLRTISSSLYAPGNEFIASFRSLLGLGDYFDYFRNERTTMRAGYDQRPFRITLAASRESPEPVETATSYDLLGRLDEARPNPPVPPHDLRSLSAAIRYGNASSSRNRNASSPRMFVNWRAAELYVEHGRVEGVSGTYTLLAGALEWRVPTFFSRRLMPNVLYLRLNGSTNWGHLPIQRFGVIDGSAGAAAFFGGLYTRRGLPYTGNRTVGVFWEHDFRTIPFELLGLRGLTRRGYSLILTGGHAQTWISDSPFIDDPLPYLPSPGMHHEIGVSLSGLFFLMRVGVAVRLDAPGASFILSTARLPEFF